MNRQAITPPATLDEFRLHVQESLPTPTHPEGDWYPFAVLQKEQGELTLLLIDPRALATRPGKELIAVELAHWMSHAPRFVAIGFSAWMAPGADDIRPSAHPGRAEALIMTAAGRDEAPRTFLSSIRRTPDGSPRLGTWTHVTDLAPSLFTEAIRLAFYLASQREEWIKSYEGPPERLGYHERRALAGALGVDPSLIQEEAPLDDAA